MQLLLSEYLSFTPPWREFYMHTDQLAMNSLGVTYQQLVRPPTDGKTNTTKKRTPIALPQPFPLILRFFFFVFFHPTTPPLIRTCSLFVLFAVGSMVPTVHLCRLAYRERTRSPAGRVQPPGTRWLWSFASNAAPSCVTANVRRSLSVHLSGSPSSLFLFPCYSPSPSHPAAVRTWECSHIPRLLSRLPSVQSLHLRPVFSFPTHSAYDTPLELTQRVVQATLKYMWRVTVADERNGN